MLMLNKRVSSSFVLNHGDYLETSACLSKRSIVLPGGGGGVEGVLNKNVDAPSRGINPYHFIYPFDQGGNPFI